MEKGKKHRMTLELGGEGCHKRRPKAQPGTLEQSKMGGGCPEASQGPPLGARSDADPERSSKTGVSWPLRDLQGKGHSGMSSHLFLLLLC